MLTTEQLDTTNIVDVPADLSTPFDSLRLPDEQRHDADNADLGRARRWGMVLQVLERLVLPVELLAASVRDGYASHGCTDTQG